MCFCIDNLYVWPAFFFVKPFDHTGSVLNIILTIKFRGIDNYYNKTITILCFHCVICQFE